MPKILSGKALPFLGALLVLLIALPQSLSFYIEWLWFQDLGFEKIFTSRLNAQLISALAGGLVAFLFSYVNLWIVVTSTRGRTIILPLHIQGMPQLDILKHVDKVKLIVPALLGFFTAMVFSGNWLTLLTYLHAADFTYVDPVFTKNASFYVFTLPLLELFSGSAMLVLAVSLISAALLYLVKGAIFIHPEGSEQSGRRRSISLSWGG